MSINPIKYLKYLLKELEKEGGKVEQRSLNHWRDALDGQTDPQNYVIVNCTGLGARNLGGIEDKKVYPVRGQLVIIKPFPEQKKISFRYHADKQGDNRTYLSYRSNEEIILGGTQVRFLLF